MLTANTKKGDKICLANEYTRATLEYWRRSEEFFCPMCGGRLMIKLGEKRIFHFSHMSAACLESNFEKESAYHLAGKKKLFQWLVRQNIPAAVEQYDPRIRQRPDITFQYENRCYALEFQCSTIPENLFIKRTENYLQANYIPLWILGGSRVPAHIGGTVTLSGFDYLFLQSSSGSPGVIPYFCPELGLFSFIQNPMPCSTAKAFASIKKIPLHQVSLNSLLSPSLSGSLDLNQWQKSLERSKLAIGGNPKSAYKPFLSELYNAGLNVFLLPPEIGLPGYFAPAISTFPVIWQTYIYLDLLAKKEPGSLLSTGEAAAGIYRRVEKGNIGLRRLPLAKEMSVEKAAGEYLEMLAAFGVLAQRGEREFLLQKELAFPKNNAEQSSMAEAFYRKYK
ncbi:competence protein CoiA [Neobacillus notoginsengisoli]|uniref:competence protein CoiA n=1 Tax=Neobacillus notoginsengisoli TaxID=1578198 RepID=UPI0013149C7B|nr:competence protein CoiA family protein [Neobacillus notoginsengisoli]